MYQEPVGLHLGVNDATLTTLSLQDPLQFHPFAPKVHSHNLSSHLHRKEAMNTHTKLDMSQLPELKHSEQSEANETKADKDLSSTALRIRLQRVIRVSL